MSYDALNDGPDHSDIRIMCSGDDKKYIEHLVQENAWLREVANAFRDEAGLSYKSKRSIEILDPDSPKLAGW